MTRNSPRVACALVATLLVPALAGAQAFSVEQLVSLALERAPSLRAARAEIGSIAGQVTQAGLRPNPTLATSHEHDPGGMRVTEASVEWPLSLFERRQARVAVAHQGSAIASWTLRDQERLLAASVREAAGRLLAAQRMLDITNEARDTAARMRELLDRRVAEGSAPKLDANIAAVEALRLDADGALALGEVQAATIELKALAALPPDATLMLADSLESLARAPAQTVPPLDEALAARPDIRQASQQLELADARAELARREARTDVTLLGGYSHSAYLFDLPGSLHAGSTSTLRGTYHAAIVGARVSLPLFDKNQGLLAVARAEREGAEATVAARQLSARAEIDAAVVRDREAQRAVGIYALAVRGLARQNVDVMLEGYDLGRFRLVELLMEQRRYLDVEAGYTEVLARAYQARVALQRGHGGVK